MSYFAPYIDDAGLRMPTYEDRLEDLVSAYRSIFGTDAELSESVPDYQLLSVFAKALDDTSALVLQSFNSRNPLYASGTSLDLLLPMYGLTREPGEDDAAVRKKISNSLSGRGAGSLDAITAVVKSCQWVRDAKVYENDTDSTDGKGIPAHSICAVIHAGNGPAVAKAIYETKAPGIGTCGSSYEDITDESGNTHRIYFSRTVSGQVSISMTVRKLAGCDEDVVRNTIGNAVRDYINGMRIADSLLIPQLYAVAYNADPAISKTFGVQDILGFRSGMSDWTRDEVPCDWNQKLSAAAGAVNITFRE